MFDFFLLERAGQQVDSTKLSASAVAFGSATRDSAGRVFISMDHEKSGYGRESPGEDHSPWASKLYSSAGQTQWQCAEC